MTLLMTQTGCKVTGSTLLWNKNMDDNHPFAVITGYVTQDAVFLEGNNFPFSKFGTLAYSWWTDPDTGLPYLGADKPAYNSFLIFKPK